MASSELREGIKRTALWIFVPSAGLMALGYFMFVAQAGLHDRSSPYANDTVLDLGYTLMRIGWPLTSFAVVLWLAVLLLKLPQVIRTAQQQSEDDKPAG